MPIPLLAMALGGAALGALSNPEDRKKGALMGLGAGLLGPAVAGAAGATGVAGAAGAAGGAGAGAAGGLAAGGAGTAAGTAAGAAGAAGAGAAGAALPAAATGATQAAAAGAPIVEAGMTTGAINANAAQLAAQQAAATAPANMTTAQLIARDAANANFMKSPVLDAGKIAAQKTGAVGPLGKIGAWGKENLPGVAGDIAKQTIVSKLTQEPQQAPAGGSHALALQAQAPSNPYQRAAVNRQTRMNQRGAGGGGPRRFI